MISFAKRKNSDSKQGGIGPKNDGGISTRLALNMNGVQSEQNRPLSSRSSGMNSARGLGKTDGLNKPSATPMNDINENRVNYFKRIQTLNNKDMSIKDKVEVNDNLKNVREMVDPTKEVSATFYFVIATQFT